MADLKDARPLFDEFLKKNNIKINRMASAMIPQGLIVPENDSVTLCGDSAGLTKPWSGGGVIWGLIASEILLKSSLDLVKYQNAAKRFFSPRIAFSKLAVKTAYCLGFRIPWILPKYLKIESDFLI